MIEYKNRKETINFLIKLLEDDSIAMKILEWYKKENEGYLFLICTCIVVSLMFNGFLYVILDTGVFSFIVGFIFVFLALYVLNDYTRERLNSNSVGYLNGCLLDKGYLGETVYSVVRRGNSFYVLGNDLEEIMNIEGLEDGDTVCEKFWYSIDNRCNLIKNKCYVKC